ncbi:MAG: MOSC N-terminal beta barrel domain-containing protein [Bacteroidota bacterium]
MNIYPVKSLGGIPVSSSLVLTKGLQHDRRWMLIDNDNIFLTQRIHNKMALFKMSFANDGFKVSLKATASQSLQQLKEIR